MIRYHVTECAPPIPCGTTASYTIDNGEGVCYGIHENRKNAEFWAQHLNEAFFEGMLHEARRNTCKGCPHAVGKDGLT